MQTKFKVEDKWILECGCQNGKRWSEGGYQTCWHNCYKGLFFMDENIFKLWKILYDEEN